VQHPVPASAKRAGKSLLCLIDTATYYRSGKPVREEKSRDFCFPVTLTRLAITGLSAEVTIRLVKNNQEHFARRVNCSIVSKTDINQHP